MQTTLSRKSRSSSTTRIFIVDDRDLSVSSKVTPLNTSDGIGRQLRAVRACLGRNALRTSLRAFDRAAEFLGDDR
jgi:hypothetical protein